MLLLFSGSCNASTAVHTYQASTERFQKRQAETHSASQLLCARLPQSHIFSYFQKLGGCQVSPALRNNTRIDTRPIEGAEVTKDLFDEVHSTGDKAVHHDAWEQGEELVLL